MRRRSRAGKPIKKRRQKTPTLKRRNASKARSGSSPAGQETELVRLARERDEALERETATADVLRVISSSPGKLEPVFQAMLEKALRICEAKFGTLYLCEGDALRPVADTRRAPPAYVEARKRKPRLPPVPDGPVGRVLITKQVVHIVDLRKLQFYLEHHPAAIDAIELGGFRTALGVPMLRDTELIGVINIMRQEVRPFTDKQIKLVENFAAQAVIAIENTRLLDELRQRTSALTESLEQQTATSEVLGVISSSPGELEPVFQAMLANATRLCEAKIGILFRYENGAYTAFAKLGV
jgi:GAF domain-containing protein